MSGERRSRGAHGPDARTGGRGAKPDARTGGRGAKPDRPGARATEDVQRFHRWSRSYERSLGQVFFFGPVHGRVLGLVAAALDGQTPGYVLDIGCGTGRLLRRIATAWPAARLTGVDPAEGMIQVARTLTPAVTFLVGHGEAIPLPNASVDVAFSTVSFHHWQDQAAGVREVARVLRPGGLFCLADIRVPAAVAWLKPRRRVHTNAEMAELFRQAGLAVLRQAGMRSGAILATIGKKG
jgi:ubiquinone/menaquinone biosynthesis C-methylase UbiE